MSQRNQKKQMAQAAMSKIVDEAAQTLSPLSCSCGCSTFTQGVMVKFITKERLSLLGGPPHNLVYQIPQLCCIKCGEPFEEPKEEIKLS